MWIRSQDKEELKKCEYYSIEQSAFSEDYVILVNGNYCFGVYSSKEKALKVLDLIQAKILEPIYENDLACCEKEIYTSKVFQMPQDDEVENNENSK